MRIHQEWRRSSCTTAVLSIAVLCSGSLDAGSARTLSEDALATPAAMVPEAPSQSPQEVDYAVAPFDARLEPTTASAPEVLGESDDYPIQSGDRLKIRVYDRPDLTDEYRVSGKGKVRIPTLGAFDAASGSAARLEQAIADALENLLQRPGIVTVEIVERRPIFVTGLVVKPGAYRFAADMAVIHAAALAGGTPSGALAPWLPSDALREGARALTSQEELKHLLARQARLEAERNSSEIAMPPELLQLAGAEEAGALLQDERVNMKHRRELLDRQAELLNRSIGEAKTEVKAFQTELAKIQEQRNIRQTALDALDSLSKKGLTTRQRLTDSQFLLASADRDAQTAIANIARSQQNLDRSERDLTVLTLDRKMSIAKELQDVAERIASAKFAIDSSRKIVAHITGLPSGGMLQDRNPQLRYEIIRKGRDGRLHTKPATEMSMLQPGDVVRVGPPGRGNYPTSVSSNLEATSSASP